jgi:UDP-2-acetamido-2-deoxy-ribo-hexuluronate aminotransferase
VVQEIQMVDLKSQYQRLKVEIDEAMQSVIDASSFINGPAVKCFETNLAEYIEVKHVIGCANGTDALQIALMAVELKKGDEVIIPAFTYAAVAEVICLLGLIPVFVDVDSETFNIDTSQIESAISANTKAIIPVHLFGQAADIKTIMEIAKKHGLFVIEDNAQSLGASVVDSEGKIQKLGGIGHIGCTSFFPSKVLGCFGDGGAVMTNDDGLAERIRMISNHGQKKKYYHSIIGVNSRLDTLQAAILDVKLNHLDDFILSRIEVAKAFNEGFKANLNVKTPLQTMQHHVYHQYVIKVDAAKRDNLKEYLSEHDIPTMIYYPLPLHQQEAYDEFSRNSELKVSEQLCNEVLALPIHTEMSSNQVNYIIETVNSFFA